MAHDQEERRPADLPLGAYLDGELDPVVRDRVAEELEAGSPALERELAALARLDEIARHAASPPPVATGEWGQVWGGIRARSVDAPVGNNAAEGPPTGRSPRAGAGVDEAWLGRYLDGELEGEPREAVAAKVERAARQDPALRRSLRRLGRLDEIARQAASPPPVDAAIWKRIWAQIADAIRRQTSATRRGGRFGSGAGSGWLRVAGSLAVAAALAAVALPLALTPGPDSRRVEPARYVARVAFEVESFVNETPDEPTLAFLDAPGANDAVIEALEPGGAYSSAVLYSSGPVVIDLRGGL